MVLRISNNNNSYDNFSSNNYYLISNNGIVNRANEALASNDVTAFVTNAVTANVSRMDQKEIQCGYENEATVDDEEETVQITGYGHYI